MPEEDFGMDELFRLAMTSPLESLPDPTPPAKKKAPEVEKPIHPYAGAWSKDKARRILPLAENSLLLKPIGENMGSYKYNEDKGVIIFTTENGVFAIPDSVHARSILQSALYKKDPAIEVPDLNSEEAWTPERSASFDRWKVLVEEHSSKNKPREV